MANCRVMVVEEDPTFRDFVISAIADRGFEVFAAADGIDALRQIYHVNPDVIVSDASLRDLSGFSFLPFVRRRFPKIGVIAVKSDLDSAFQPKEVVADEIIPRSPFNFVRFVQLVEEFSRRASVKRQHDLLHLRLIEIAEQEMKCADEVRCATCESLLDALGRALFNSLLSTAWERDMPDAPQPTPPCEIAELSLGRALRTLDHHKHESHFECAG